MEKNILGNLEKRIIKIVKLGVILVLAALNFACSSLFLREEKGPDNTINSYYSKNKLPKLEYQTAKNPDYFRFVNDTDEGFLSGENEGEYLSFFKDKGIGGYGSGSSYWRWDITFSQSQIDAILNNNLYELGKSRPKNVYTLKNGKWVSGSVAKNPIGTVKNLKVVKRGSSGVVLDFYIEGSKGTYVVTKENYVRRVLSYSKNSLNGVTSPQLKGKTGKNLSSGSTLFPSGFFAVEKSRKGFTIYGGGFGHGVGMPQWAVRDLAKKGHNYETILKRYYKGIDIKNAKSIDGFQGKLRVGITKNSKPEHSDITLSSPGKLKLKSGWSSYTASKNAKVKFKRTKGETVATVNGKVVLKSKDKIDVSSNEMIRVDSITRALRKRTPEYRGVFEITPYAGNSLLLINTIGLEDYLRQVVGSEMPHSFGLEALKVQAVAARTYAVNGVLERKYKKYNFDVVDTVASQVYNNLDEAEVVDKAIKATKGEVMTYKGKIIPAFFYSTSAGYSATPKEIW